MSNNMNYHNNGGNENKIEGSEKIYINSPQQKTSENKTTVYKKIQYPKRITKNQRESYRYIFFI